MAAAYKLRHVAVLNDLGLGFCDAKRWPECKFYSQHDCPYIPYDVVIVGVVSGHQDTFDRAEEWLQSYRRINPQSRYILAVRKSRPNTPYQQMLLRKWRLEGAEIVEKQ